MKTKRRSRGVVGLAFLAVVGIVLSTALPWPRAASARRLQTSTVSLKLLTALPFLLAQRVCPVANTSQVLSEDFYDHQAQGWSIEPPGSWRFSETISFGPIGALSLSN